MSHEVETMAWTNEVPWHGLGVEMDPNATPMEWLNASGLNWTVERVPMEATLPNGERVVVEGSSQSEYGVLVRNRESEYDVFGPVGPDWIPVQNSQVFDFLKRFCDAGSMKMETCGSLKNGTEIWALCKFRDDFEPIAGDPMKGYLLFHSAHVWGKGNQIRVTPIRVVCNNTLTMALQLKGEGQNIVRMPHLSEFTRDVQDTAIEAMGLAQHQMDQFGEAVQMLSSKKYNADTLEEFIGRIYCKGIKVGDKGIREQFTPSAETVLDCIASAPGADLKGSKGTWWGALNGVTYHEDHMRMSYTGDGSNALGSAWFGGGAKKKDLAVKLALEYAA